MSWIKNHSLILMAALIVCLGMLVPAWSQDEKSTYDQVKSDYIWLLNHEKAQRVYGNWRSLADRFNRVFAAYPHGPYASGALYWMARIHKGAYEKFQRKADFYAGMDSAKRLVNHFPKSRLADDAQYIIGQLMEDSGQMEQAYLAYLKVTVDYPGGDMVPPAKTKLDELEQKLTQPGAKTAEKDTAKAEPKPDEAQSEKAQPEKAKPAPAEEPQKPEEPQPDLNLAEVSSLRHWSTKSYTRVVLSLERPVPYKSHLLKKNLKHGKPRRLYLDLRGARLTPSVQDNVPIKGALLVQARVGQFSKDTVRMVLDINNLTSYKVFSLDNPFRVVVDCFGSTEPEPEKNRIKLTKLSKGKYAHKVKRGRAKQKPPAVSLAAQLGLGIRKVVLDPGHGGKDPGANYRGLMEKDITLSIAKLAKPKIEKALGCEVILTRDRDVFLPLEDRTAIANTREADLFISLHVNAAPSHRLNGLETYYLNLASDQEAMRVAARENATSKRSISDLEVILNDLMMNSKINESNRLARALHKSTLRKLQTTYKVRDLKVKQAPFYVLIGARMPAVLCEVGFITNSVDHRRLGSTRYREHLAQGLTNGLTAYAKSLKKK